MSEVERLERSRPRDMRKDGGSGKGPTPTILSDRARGYDMNVCSCRSAPRQAGEFRPDLRGTTLHGVALRLLSPEGSAANAVSVCRSSPRASPFACAGPQLVHRRRGVAVPAGGRQREGVDPGASRRGTDRARGRAQPLPAGADARRSVLVGHAARRGVLERPAIRRARPDSSASRSRGREPRSVRRRRRPTVCQYLHGDPAPLSLGRDSPVNLAFSRFPFRFAGQAGDLRCARW